MTLDASRCPECGSENIDYIDQDADFDKIISKGVCSNCDCLWDAHYKISKIETHRSESEE